MGISPPTTLHALLILSWRGCLAAGQASYTRHLGSLRQLAIHARNLRYFLAHCARSRRSSKTTGATTRSRSLAFPVTAYGASHCGAGPSSSPFVTFTLKMPVALPYPRMLSMLLGSISPNVFPHGALSCTPWHTPLRTAHHLCAPCSSSFGAVAWPQAKLRTLVTLYPSDASFLALPPHCARSRRSLKTTGDSRPTSAGTGAAAPWNFAGKWLAGEQRRAVQRFARLCSLLFGCLHHHSQSAAE